MALQVLSVWGRGPYTPRSPTPGTGSQSPGHGLVFPGLYPVPTLRSHHNTEQQAVLQQWGRPHVDRWLPPRHRTSSRTAVGVNTVPVSAGGDRVWPVFHFRPNASSDAVLVQERGHHSLFCTPAPHLGPGPPGSSTATASQGHGQSRRRN